ncbi:hypothetical protein K8R43_00630 [archaeon]|nr:hypothetical protein [archaeon]
MKSILLISSMLVAIMLIGCIGGGETPPRTEPVPEIPNPTESIKEISYKGECGFLDEKYATIYKDSYGGDEKYLGVGMVCNTTSDCQELTDFFCEHRANGPAEEYACERDWECVDIIINDVREKLEIYDPFDCETDEDCYGYYNVDGTLPNEYDNQLLASRRALLNCADSKCQISQKYYLFMTFFGYPPF